jgi:ribonuclease P protein component
MLFKENRLKKDKDFKRVFKEGKGAKEGFLFFKWAPNKLKISRFGFVVSQKVSKKAVLRNKIKRRLREIIRARTPRIKKGIDGIFIASQGLIEKNYKELERLVDIIFKKTKIY